MRVLDALRTVGSTVKLCMSPAEVREHAARKTREGMQACLMRCEDRSVPDVGLAPGLADAGVALAPDTGVMLVAQDHVPADGVLTADALEGQQGEIVDLSRARREAGVEGGGDIAATWRELQTSTAAQDEFRTRLGGVGVPKATIERALETIAHTQDAPLVTTEVAFNSPSTTSGSPFEAPRYPPGAHPVDQPPVNRTLDGRTDDPKVVRERIYADKSRIKEIREFGDKLTDGQRKQIDDLQKEVDRLERELRERPTPEQKPDGKPTGEPNTEPETKPIPFSVDLSGVRRPIEEFLRDPNAPWIVVGGVVGAIVLVGGFVVLRQQSRAG